MRGIPGTLALLAALTAAAGCVPPQSGEFVLPEGDPETGRELFVTYNCTSCHTVPNLDLPEPDADAPIRIPLGGRVSKVKSYPELVTSIINPSHRFVPRRRVEDVSEDGESLMTVYNDVMTVTELVNLVAFLESRYEKLQRPGYRYRSYSISE